MKPELVALRDAYHATLIKMRELMEHCYNLTKSEQSERTIQELRLRISELSEVLNRLELVLSAYEAAEKSAHQAVERKGRG